MLVTRLLFVSLLYPSHCYYREHCRPPFRPPYHRFKAVRASQQLEVLPSPKFNLLYQILQHPCLELEYLGGYYSMASQYHLYGTCNYQRMFRFTMRQTFYQCWNLELIIWDRTVPGTQGFDRHRPSTERYEIVLGTPEGSARVTETIGNFTRTIVFVPRDEPLDEGALRRSFGYFGPPGGEGDGPYASIPTCHCSNRSQIEVWSKGDADDAQNTTFFVVGHLFVFVVLATLGYAAFQTLMTRSHSWSMWFKRR